MRWSNDDTRLTIGDVEFLTMGSDRSEELIRVLALGNFKSTGDRLVLLKPRRVIERYVDLVRDLQPARVLDLGIFEGGSAALLAACSTADRVVAIDCRPDRVGGLDDFIAKRDLLDRVRPHYGIDQGDVSALRTILDDELPGPIDLVLDDCSHRYAPTVSAFDLVYPRLRPGGLYVIEDWPWGVVPLATPELTDSLLRTLPPRPLAEFVVELALAAASRPDIVAKVTIDDSMVVVQRGSADLDVGFRLVDCRWDELEVSLRLPPR